MARRSVQVEFLTWPKHTVAYYGALMNPQSILRMLIVVLASLAGFVVLASAASCPAGQARDQKVLLEQEEKWAKALDHNDVHAVGCLLGEEFQDADVNGQVHNRAEALARAAQPRHGTNRLEEMHAHTYGDAGYVRGLNRVVNANGEVVATVRFTDVFVYRERRWQAVAGQETMVTEKK
jgi:hypothetical protein